MKTGFKFFLAAWIAFTLSACKDALTLNSKDRQKEDLEKLMSYVTTSLSFDSFRSLVDLSKQPIPIKDLSEKLIYLGVDEDVANGLLFFTINSKPNIYFYYNSCSGREAENINFKKCKVLYVWTIGNNRINEWGQNDDVVIFKEVNLKNSEK
jgi:hypothetical protein